MRSRKPALSEAEGDPSSMQTIVGPASHFHHRRAAPVWDEWKPRVPHFSLPLREVGLFSRYHHQHAWRAEQPLPNDIDKSRFVLICLYNPLE